MLREYIYLTDDEIQLTPICEDCGPNAVPIMRKEELIRCKDCRFRKFVKYSHKEQEWGWYFCTRKQTDDPIITDDDDFCSWAERKEEHETD